MHVTPVGIPLAGAGCRSVTGGCAGAVLGQTEVNLDEVMDLTVGLC